MPFLFRPEHGPEDEKQRQRGEREECVCGCSVEEVLKLRFYTLRIDITHDMGMSVSGVVIEHSKEYKMYEMSLSMTPRGRSHR